MKRFCSFLGAGADERPRAVYLFDPQITFRCSQGISMRGRRAFLAYLRTLQSGISPAGVEILDCVVEGDKAFTKVLFSGYHVGYFRGHTPSGNRLEWPGAILLDCRGQLITNLWVLSDLYCLDQDLRRNSRANFQADRYQH